MRRVLNNDELEKQFQKDGFVQVPFISEKEVAELKQRFFDTLPESGGQITSGDIGAEGEHLITYDFTFIDKNPEYKRKVFKIITEYFEPHMNRLLADYRPIIANYIRKQAAAGEVPLHQNWAFADERNSAAYHVRKNKSMKPLFINKEHQIFFEQNGYLILPALDANDIEALKSFYFSLGLKDEKGYGFHVGMDNEDKQLVTEMVNTIKSVALPKIQPYLVDTQLFTASFVIKESNPQGVVPPHQDWSFVEDEDKYCSVTCWIPLQDVNMENGCMGVIKGSHHFFDAFRASPSPQVGTPLKDHMFTIFPFLQLIEMKAGEALIFNNKTIHASPPNTTNEPRLAVGLGFTQKEANICHYYLKPGSTDKVLKYNIDPHFFFKYDNSKLSRMYDEGKLIEGYGNPEEVEFNFENLSAEDFTKRITEAGNSYNASLVSTMAKLFNYNADGTEKSGSTSQDEKIEISISNSDQNDETIIPFWKVYTPLNVIREIKHRLTSKL